MRLLVTLLAVVSMLAGCGGSGGGAAQSKTESPSTNANAPTVGQALIAVTAAPGALHFDQTTYRARAGKVAIGLRNLGAVRRSIAIRGHGVDARGPIVGKGKISVVSVSLEPGTYVLYSSPGGNEASELQARLIVTG